MSQGSSNFNFEVRNSTNLKKIIRFIQVCRTSWPLTKSAFVCSLSLINFDSFDASRVCAAIFFPISYKPHVTAQACNLSLQFPCPSYTFFLCLLVLISYYVIKFCFKINVQTHTQTHISIGGPHWKMLNLNLKPNCVNQVMTMIILFFN